MTVSIIVALAFCLVGVISLLWSLFSKKLVNKPKKFIVASALVYLTGVITILCITLFYEKAGLRFTVFADVLVTAVFISSAFFIVQFDVACKNLISSKVKGDSDGPKDKD